MTEFANATSQALVVLPALEVEKLVARAVGAALLEFKRALQPPTPEQRLTSQQAADFLGRSVGYLRALHKQGLTYEKGRPNFYKLSDLESWRESRRLQLT